MAIEIKLNYEDIFGDMKWDLDKVKYLLTDVQKYFDCPDLEYPPRENIESIRNEYMHIAVLLSLVYDLITKLEDTVTPLV